MAGGEGGRGEHRQTQRRASSVFRVAREAGSAARLEKTDETARRAAADPREPGSSIPREGPEGGKQVQSASRLFVKYLFSRPLDCFDGTLRSFSYFEQKKLYCGVGWVVVGVMKSAV